jgi:hypothetical protein
LPDARAEVDGAVEDDVGDREAVAGDELLVREVRVDPGEVVARRRLQAVGGLGDDAQAILEGLETLSTTTSTATSTTTSTTLIPCAIDVGQDPPVCGGQCPGTDRCVALPDGSDCFCAPCSE